MAGIGFDLRNLAVDDAGVFSRCRAYAAAGMIAAGPWIVTMFGLWVVRLATTRVDPDVQDAFFAIVSHAFAASLISVGGVQMAVTRWLADVLYRREYQRLLPGFSACLAVVGAVQVVIGAALCAWLGFDAELTVAATALYVAISSSWIAMVWLCVIRQYDRIMVSFLLGMGVFWLLLAAMPERDLPRVVLAFATGTGLSVALMVGLVVRGTERPESSGFDVFRSLRDYTSLVAIGSLCGLSLWADKFVFWALAGEPVFGAIHHHPLYDSCFYLGYLTVVPALSVNLVQLETTFYEKYRRYYDAVTGDQPLRTIRRRRREMVDALRAGCVRVIRVQGFVTAACIVFGGVIVGWLGMPEFAGRVFRLTCLGALFHVMLLILVLIQLYFDLRREALATVLAFLALNASLAGWSVLAGPASYGAGYAVAALGGALFGLLLLRRAIGDLDYVTFTRYASGRA